MRLDDAVTYFLGQWAVEGPTEATIYTYGAQLTWLVAFAASRNKTLLSDLTPEFLRAAMAAKLAPKIPHRTFKGGEAAANSLAYAARKMARWLLAQGVPVADLTRVKPKRPPERIQPRLHQHEFAAMEGAILKRLVAGRLKTPRLTVARDLALIYLLADTGLRASEMCAMDVRSVDLERGAVLVLRGKGKKERALSILDPNDRHGGPTIRLLTDWIATRGSIQLATLHNKLWTSVKGKPLDVEQLRRILNRLCVDASIPDNRPPHSFRRASFTEAYLAQPTSIRVLAARMGWSPRSHTMIDIYTRGAEVDLARDTPIQSLSSLWASPNGPSRALGPRPMLNTKVNGRAVPNLAGRDTDTTANQTPRRRSVPQA